MAVDMFEEIVIPILTSAAVTGIAFALFKDMLSTRLKAAIENEYAGKLENLKAQLKASNDAEIETLKVRLKAEADIQQEKLKSQLQIVAAQENATFIRLHERRVDAIEHVFNSLLVVRDAVGRYINAYQPAGAPSDNENLKLVQAAYDEFKPSFVKNQIFLPRHIAAAVSDIDQTFLNITNQFTLIVKANTQISNTDLWIKLIERFQTEVTQALESLNEDMRVALGDKST